MTPAVLKPSESKTEEMIAALWFITAFLAKLTEFPRWVWMLFLFKAIIDVVCSIWLAQLEVKNEKKTLR
jgi:uncharacterized membrane protein